MQLYEDSYFSISLVTIRPCIPKTLYAIAAAYTAWEEQFPTGRDWQDDFSLVGDAYIAWYLAADLWSQATVSMRIDILNLK